MRVLIVALGQTQSLFVAFQGRFDPTATLVVKRDIRHQNCDGISDLRAFAQATTSRSARAFCEGAVFPATPHGNASHRTDIASSGFGDPANRALGPDRVLNPLCDRLSQTENPLARILFS
jgi:hypothetical protein